MPKGIIVCTRQRKPPWSWRKAALLISSDILHIEYMYTVKYIIVICFIPALILRDFLFILFFYVRFITRVTGEGLIFSWYSSSASSQRIWTVKSSYGLLFFLFSFITFDKLLQTWDSGVALRNCGGCQIAQNANFYKLLPSGYWNCI